MPRSRSFTVGKVVAGAFFVALVVGIVIMERQSPPVQMGVLLGGDDDAPRVLPKPILDNPKGSNALQTAVFAGGCFWGVQAVFEHVHGVRRVLAGYSGGKKDTAQYSLVSTDTTGHAESIQIAFDPGQVSYGELLQIFFSIAHNRPN